MRKRIGKIILWFVQGLYVQDNHFYEFLFSIFKTTVTDAIEDDKRDWYYKKDIDLEFRDLVRALIGKAESKMRDSLAEEISKMDAKAISNSKDSRDALNKIIKDFNSSLAEEEFIVQVVKRINNNQIRGGKDLNG